MSRRQQHWREQARVKKVRWRRKKVRSILLGYEIGKIEIGQSEWGAMLAGL